MRNTCFSSEFSLPGCPLHHTNDLTILDTMLSNSLNYMLHIFQYYDKIHPGPMSGTVIIVTH